MGLDIDRCINNRSRAFPSPWLQFQVSHNVEQVSMHKLLYNIIESIILPQFIKAQHLHGQCLLYKERNNIYHEHLYL